MTPQPPSPEQQQRELIAEIAALGRCLPGSITTRQMRCGRERCACKADPPKLHGPYTTWTRKVAGKTVTRRLSPEQAQRYRPWFEDSRRLRALISELEALSIQAAERAERWGEK